MQTVDENSLGRIIVDSAIEVHRELGGAGLLESVYDESLAEELRLRDLVVERQQAVPLFYKGKSLATPLRLDLRINGLVIVDPKTVTEYNPVFDAQMLTYLRLTKLKLGLVINFGEHLVKDGIHRIVNRL
jgi:GxxExxY protein